MIKRIIAPLLVAVLSIVPAQIVVIPRAGGGGTTIINNTFNTTIQNTSGNFVNQGCQVVWLTLYQFQVSACDYTIENVAYSITSAQTVTLDAPDGSNPRLDVIVVNTSLAATFVKGTASATPSEPSIDSGSQLKLALVLVTNGTTSPVGVSNTTVYADNAGGPTEWNCTTSGTGFDCNSTNNPKPPSTKDIEITAATNGSYVQLQIPASTLDPSTTQQLVLFIRSKATWNNNRGLQVGLFSAGVLKGQNVTINRSGTWGFASSNTTDYQQVAIPIANFAVPIGSTITQVRIADFGGSIGAYLDDIYFQIGGFQLPVGDFVKGPASATDNAIARYDGTTGKLIQNSTTTVDDTGNVISSGGQGIYFGTTHPQGNQAAALGSIYYRSDGRTYVKRGGSSTAYGWYLQTLDQGEYTGSDVMCGLGASAANTASANALGGALTGTMAANADIFGNRCALTTSTSINTEAEYRVNSTGPASFSVGQEFDYSIDITTGTVSTLQRIWVGVINDTNGYGNADDQTNANYSFRYSTAASDTGFRGVVDSGAGQSLTASELAAFGISTRYRLRIRGEENTGGTGNQNICFSANDGTEQCVASNLPATGVFMGMAQSVWTLEAGVARTLFWYRSRLTAGRGYGR
jgi:hypothetical protein